MLENIYKKEIENNGFDAENYFVKGQRDDLVESQRSNIDMYTGDKSSRSSAKDPYSNVLERPSDMSKQLERQFGGGDNGGNKNIGGG